MLFRVSKIIIIHDPLLYSCSRFFVCNEVGLRTNDILIICKRDTWIPITHLFCVLCMLYVKGRCVVHMLLMTGLKCEMVNVYYNCFAN